MKTFNRDEIKKMKYVAKNIMTFFLPYISFCPPSVSLLAFCQLVSSCVLSVCLFVRLPVCLNNSLPPGIPQSAFKFCTTLPPATQACGPSCCDLHRPTIKTQFYRGCYCTVKGSFQSPTCCCSIKVGM